MDRRDFMYCSMALAATGIGNPAIASETFPSATVRLINAAPPGSAPDAVFRALAERLQRRWKQPVIVESRPGAAGFLAAGEAKRAPPTGHGLFLADVGNLSINPSLFRKLPYDPEQDFAPVSMLYRTTFYIVVGAGSPWRSVGDLVAAAQSRPEGITFGSFGIGSTLHLGGEMLKHATQSRMTHVPFKESTQTYVAIASGEIDFGFASVGTAGPLIQSGKLRYLAIAGPQRAAMLPQVPTLQESGGPADLLVDTWFAMLAPAGTPATAIQAINEGVAQELRTPELLRTMETFGFEPAPGAPAALAQQMKLDRERYAAVIRRLNLSLN